jgi:multimeric flavodoxin WrbA
MKVVALFGSPRVNGNTASLTKTFNKTVEDLGADVQTFFLNKFDAKGCQACDACKTKTDHCIIKDDIATVLESVKDADVLVAATPIYFADVSAQFKIFVDRCYSYLEPFETMPKTSRLKKGKKFVLITAQNREEDMFAEVCTKYRMLFEFLGFDETHLIRGCDLMETDALKTKNRQDLFELAKETAKKVITPGV